MEKQDEHWPGYDQPWENLLYFIHCQFLSMELTQEEADALIHTIQQRVRRKE